MALLRIVLCFCILLGVVTSLPAPSSSKDHSIAAFRVLQSSYWDVSAGWWNSSMWWQTANTVEAITLLAQREPSLRHEVSTILEVVFAATSNDTRGRCDIGVDKTFSGYFDDEDWWGHAWLHAFELTGNSSYLQRSQAILDDLADRAWSEASCGGGVCWQASKDPSQMGGCYKNAITNELFLSHAAQLALVHRRQCETAGISMANCSGHSHNLRWAQKELKWLLGSGMINASSLVNDGLDTFTNHESVCLNNRHTAYTYNQGVILSGLGYMWQLQSDAAPLSGSSGSDALLHLAAKIVTAVFSSNLTYAGTHILREMDEVVQLPIANLYGGSPGTDGLQFKSIFIRHLRYLLDVIQGDTTGAAQAAVRDGGGSVKLWQSYIAENAHSIWHNAACAPVVPLAVGSVMHTPPLFGYIWTGPCSWAFGGPTATTQTAALDVFTADAATEL